MKEPYYAIGAIKGSGAMGFTALDFKPSRGRYWKWLDQRKIKINKVRRKRTTIILRINITLKLYYSLQYHLTYTSLYSIASIALIASSDSLGDLRQAPIQLRIKSPHTKKSWLKDAWCHLSPGSWRRSYSPNLTTKARRGTKLYREGLIKERRRGRLRRRWRLAGKAS